MHCTAIYMKTYCLQTNETQHCLGKESALGAIAGGERVVLIKSLISKDVLGVQGCQVQLKSSADNFQNLGPMLYTFLDRKFRSLDS